MAGIGKTTLALKIFEDPEIKSHFEHRVFVTVGPKCKFEEVMLRIVTQLPPHIDEIHNIGFENVRKYLSQELSNKRYLIVLDDVWIKNISWVCKFLPPYPYGSWILVTTRLDEVAYSPSSLNEVEYPVGVAYSRKKVHRMPFLNKEESFDLLCERVFGQESICPLQLEKYGEKIAENCEGLPLTIVVVAGILSKNEKTPEYWKKTAEKKNSVFTDAYDQMFPVLFLSYKYLSPSLKPSFLYTGVFPPSWKITTSKLVKLLSAEGILRTEWQTSEHLAREHLKDVISKNLVLVDQQSSNYGHKTWSLHSANWHMCSKVARMEKFFYVMNCYPRSISTEDIKSQQRLCVHNNVLLGIREVYNSIESISTVRSLLCTDPYHQYPVSMCFGLSFLRVLDALAVRFYKFPAEVLKLVQLRYLALTCNGNIPASICKLWSLEYFFVRRHLTIKPIGAWSYLPMEIWNMKELRHLQVMGSNLPYHCDAELPNLLTLSDMSADSCIVEILKGTPNLRKLGIQVELPPDAAEPLSFFDQISHLSELRSLKCIIVNPKPRSHVVAPLTAFPSNLRKLNLSGCGYPWKYMSMIAELPYLAVLKLKCYAFQGPEWNTEGIFRSLKFLLIEETDLVQWVADSSCFPVLRRLMVRHCYKLKGIPSGIWDNRYFVTETIELVDCPSALNSAKQIQEKNEMEIEMEMALQKRLDYEEWVLRVRNTKLPKLPKLWVQSSWDDGKVKS